MEVQVLDSHSRPVDGNDRQQHGQILCQPWGEVQSHTETCRAEDLVARSLEARGIPILLRNFRRRTGELDVVALEAGVLVIIEVRMRSRQDFGE